MRKKVLYLVTVLIVFNMGGSFSQNLWKDFSFSSKIFETSQGTRNINVVQKGNEVYVPLSEIKMWPEIFVSESDLGKIIIQNADMKKEKNRIWNNEGLYLGDKNNGLPEGKGHFYKMDGISYRGDFKKGLFHGKGTLVKSNGSVVIGNFEKGFPHGECEVIYKNGDRYQGEVYYGILTGKGQMRYANGNLYKGFFLDGLYEGAGYYRVLGKPEKGGIWERGHYKKYLSPAELKKILSD